ncbi:MAG: hypothetical protein SV377_02530 [Halobacteria archaeon]|nr:hypothetical protein [Halobacteria archaeon]
MERVTKIVGVVLALHLIAGMLHGLPHFSVPVELKAWQWVFILLVINLIPVVGFILIWRQYPRLGSAIFTVSMAGALLFGLYSHFLVPNPDNVGHVHGVWHLPFLLTAVLVAATDFVGVVTGAWVLTSKTSKE